jgi:hypothetical protein
MFSNLFRAWLLHDLCHQSPLQEEESFAHNSTPRIKPDVLMLSLKK